MDKGYWRIFILNSKIKYYAPDNCRSIEEFTFTGYRRPASNQIPISFEFVNDGWWQATICQGYTKHSRFNVRYNGETCQPNLTIKPKSGDCFQLKYVYDVRDPVCIYFECDRLYWNLDEAVDKLKYQYGTEVQLVETKKREDVEAKLQAEIASVQQTLQQEQRQRAVVEAKYKEFHLEFASVQLTLQEELRQRAEAETKSKEMEEELRTEIADLHLASQLLQEKSLAELECTKIANTDEIRKCQDVEANLRVEIANLQHALREKEQVTKPQMTEIDIVEDQQVLAEDEPQPEVDRGSNAPESDTDISVDHNCVNCDSELSEDDAALDSCHRYCKACAVKLWNAVWVKIRRRVDVYVA